MFRCVKHFINNSKSSKNEIIKVNTQDKFNNMNNNSLIDNENIIDYIDSYLKNLLLKINKKKSDCLLGNEEDLLCADLHIKINDDFHKMKKFDRKVSTYNRYINDYLDYKNKTLKDRLNYLNSNPNLKPELLDIAQRIHSQK